MQLTDYQKKIMRHTVSDHDRNWFGTGPCTKDSREFEVLVKAGLATVQAAPFGSTEVLYRLTDEGKKAIGS